MNRILHLVAAGALAIGGLALTGCEDNLPPGENGATAGGNGAFGESPARPGQYGTTPAPVTQPSGANSNDQDVTPPKPTTQPASVPFWDQPLLPLFYQQ